MGFVTLLVLLTLINVNFIFSFSFYPLAAVPFLSHSYFSPCRAILRVFPTFLLTFAFVFSSLSGLQLFASFRDFHFQISSSVLSPSLLLLPFLLFCLICTVST